MKRFASRRTVLLFLLLLPAALAVAPLRAQEPEMKRLELLDMPGKWWKHPRAVEALKLTPQQTDRIDAIFLEHRKALIDLKAKMEKQLIDFRALADQPEVKRDEALRMIDQISATRAEIARNTILLQLDIRDQLTLEQRSALKKMRSEFRDDFRQDQQRRRMEGGERGQRQRGDGPPPPPED
jgi:Spy/CpxP family protein refolding chaperone